MSFLAPLYLLAGLAVSLPLIFHLIQRKPRGEQIFSSLLFLSPSPPRLVRKSRLDQWLLFLLRALALVAIAFAFMRPFLRDGSLMDRGEVGKQRLILVDSSASMRKAGVWDEAMRLVDEAIAESKPQDLVAIYRFDSQLRPVVPFESIREIASPERPATLRKAISSIAPSWLPTDLGQALSVAADTLKTTVNEQNPADTIGGEIILISDLNSGANLSRLEGYQWPKEVRVISRQVKPSDKSNASITLLAAEQVDADSMNSLRLLVKNAATNDRSEFRLEFQNDRGDTVKTIDPPLQLAAGQSRVITLNELPADGASVLLTGDSDACDNRIFFTVRERQTRNVIVLQRDSPKAEESLSYFLERVPLGDASREVKFVSATESTLSTVVNPEEFPLVVSDNSLSPVSGQILREYATKGGHILLVLDRELSESDNLAATEAIQKLIGGSTFQMAEAKIRDYAMWESIDFQHPLFVPLADARFNDFTRVRFWKHRTAIIDPQLNHRELAKFDDGDPALIEIPIERGTCWILATGWQPAESQLALSTKFVPLLTGLFRISQPTADLPKSLSVGQEIEIGEASQLIAPSGVTVERNRQGSAELAEPGKYVLKGDQGTQLLAVNLPAREFDDSSFDSDRLEQLGVAVGALPTAEKILDQRRQMQNAELESQQQVWRWCILAAAIFVAAESIWSSFASRSTSLAPGQG